MTLKTSIYILIFICVVNKLNGQIMTSQFGASHPSILSVPNPPTIGTVSTFGLTATVPFTAPMNNGASTITSYTVTSNPGGITGSLSQSGSGSITISGLTSGTSYTFSVTATNSIGTSVASNASNSVTAMELTSRILSFESNNDLPLSLHGTTWSSNGAWNSIRSYGGTVYDGNYSWMVNLDYNQAVELLNSAPFNAKSIWVLNDGMGSVSQITIKGYNSSNVLVGTILANVSGWGYQQVTLNLNSVRKLVISSNATYCDMMDWSCYGGNYIYFDALSYDQ
uniref:fibronectin type III domain-containing protein n=1 Tax=Algoriphagus sp. TaxID=1872435 RepID=UPI0040474897